MAKNNDKILYGILIFMALIILLLVGMSFSDNLGKGFQKDNFRITLNEKEVGVVCLDIINGECIGILKEDLTINMLERNCRLIKNFGDEKIIREDSDFLFNKVYQCGNYKVDVND